MAKGIYRYARRRDGTRYRIYNTRRPVYRRRSIYPKRRSVVRLGRVPGIRKDAMGDTIMGYGAYYKGGRATSSRPPKVVNHPDGRVIVRHAEYIADVPAAQGFALATFPLNPGMSLTFPWLSRVAQNFEEWVPRGIFFEFKSTSSDAVVSTNTNSSLGQIAMATQYNSVDTNFVNNQQLLNYENANTEKPSKNFRHYIECKRSQTVLDEMYVRTGPIPPNADLRMYDLGKTSVSSSNNQSASPVALGQLWISYEIELRKPKIPLESVSKFAGISIAATAFPNTTITAAKPFGTSDTKNVQDVQYQQRGGLPDAWVSGSSTQNYGLFSLGAFAAGYYKIIIVSPIQATTGTQGSVTVNALSGGGVVAPFGGLSAFPLPTSTLAQNIVGAFTVNVTGPNNLFTITCSGNWGGGNTVSGMTFIAIEAPDTPI